MQIDAGQIAGACREFYQPKIQADHNKFYKPDRMRDKFNKPLLDVKFAENEFPIRLGRFSHIECTTVDNFRDPGGAAAKRGYGNTRTLSNGELAMGWAKVTLQ